MAWKKLGKIFCPVDTYDWMYSHASNTVAAPLEEDGHFRIYFSCRNQSSQAHIGYVDIDIANPTNVLRISESPVLSPGPKGDFDDSGLSLACIADVKGMTYMYYLGWNLAVSVPFRNSIGVAVKDKKTGCFEKISKGPIMDRSMNDPYTLSYPFVFQEEGAYKMWYGSHQMWGKTTDDMIHVMKYAESADGLNWSRKNIICLDADEKDYAFSRPFVLKENGIYKMWYSFRGGKYRIGYAESKDGLEWVRKDAIGGLEVSSTGWDDNMVCYPYLFHHNDCRYLLYNGNEYGKTGFGIAIWQDN